MVNKEAQSPRFVIPLCYLFEQLKVKIVDIVKLHKVKILDWNTLQSYANKSSLISEEIIAIKIEGKKERKKKKKCQGQVIGPRNQNKIGPLIRF